MTYPSNKLVTFALMGVCSYITPGHLKAIRDTSVTPIDTCKILGNLEINNPRVVRL